MISRHIKTKAHGLLCFAVIWYKLFIHTLHGLLIYIQVIFWAPLLHIFLIYKYIIYVKLDRHEQPIIPLNCRICKCCQQDSIDDERHFLVDCHFHDDDRYTLLDMLEVMSNYINDLDGKNSREKFILIMACKEIPALNALGKCIHNCFQKRKSC